MDVVNMSRSRRFLRERPMRVTLFDRPRLVFELICLESEQEETRRGFEASDSLILLLEGSGRIRMGPQLEDLQEMDAVLVPPGTEHRITNTGPGRLTAAVLLTPKPSRAGEVRMPREPRPARAPARPYGERGERERPPRREGAGPSRFAARGEERPRTGGAPARGRREGGEGDGPAWYPKPKPAWRPRGAPPATGAGARGRTGRPPAGGRPYAGRGPRPDGGRGAGEAPRFGQGGEGSTEERPVRRGPARPPAARGGPSRGAPGRGGSRRTDGKKTGDARRASRGQGPLSGRRGPGRSGPRT